MKRTRKQIGQILDRSLAWHRNPSRSEIDSAVNRVWDSLPAHESVGLDETLELHPARPRAKSRAWRLAAVAAVLIVLSLTFIRRPQPNDYAPLPPIDVTADANVDALLMEAVSVHISRTIPAPMEPIMTLIPTQPGESE
jgi:hypothetical protein